MTKLKNNFVSIIVLILLITFCKRCTTDHFRGSNIKLIPIYEKMIADKSTIEAELYPEYTETTLKVMRIPVKSYEFKYHFEIENKTYEGEYTFESELPKSTKLKVYYLKSDPSYHCTNPQKNLKSLKEKNSSNANLYWGIGWGILSIILGLTILINLFKKS